MTTKRFGELTPRSRETLGMVDGEEGGTERVHGHASHTAPNMCSGQDPMRTVLAVSSVTRRARTLAPVPGTSLLDDAVRIWLARVLEKHSISEVSRWMGYQKSRTQLRGYLAREDLAFRVEWIQRIAEGLGITPDAALLEIRDIVIRLREAAASPLPGRAARLAEQPEEPQQDPAAKKAK
jgi:hypothetical protein